MCSCLPGQCKSRFTSRKVPYCVQFHPDDDKQDFFVAGTSDKKIVCVSSPPPPVLTKLFVALCIVDGGV